MLIWEKKGSVGEGHCGKSKASDEFIYEGWEPNQRATIQEFAHGMKSKRNSSFSGKNSLKMQSARPSGPKLDYFCFLILSCFSLFFYCLLYFAIVSYFGLFFPMFCYFPLFCDIWFFMFYSRKLLFFVFIIVYFLRPLIRCPLNRLPILIEDEFWTPWPHFLSNDLLFSDVPPSPGAWPNGPGDAPPPQNQPARGLQSLRISGGFKQDIALRIVSWWFVHANVLE